MLLSANADNSRDIVYEFVTLGDRAVIIRLGNVISEQTNQLVRRIDGHLEHAPFIGFVACVPSFAAVTVHYDPLIVSRSRNVAEQGHATIFDTVCSRLKPYLDMEQPKTDYQLPRTIEIPVCYGGEFGPDLRFVAENNGLAEEDVIALHSDASYLVYMLGFAPGFPYLGGMSERIAAPRHRTPRTSTPQGSVGIAGKQTGIYSITTPGGWQLIGRTPLVLFHPHEEIPSLLRAGDRVRFNPITSEQFKQYKAGEL